MEKEQNNKYFCFASNEGKRIFIGKLLVIRTFFFPFNFQLCFNKSSKKYGKNGNCLITINEE